MIEYAQHRKGCDEDGLVAASTESRRLVQDGENASETHHFRAGEPKFVGFSRMPALRDRACQSLKGRQVAVI